MASEEEAEVEVEGELLGRGTSLLGFRLGERVDFKKEVELVVGLGLAVVLFGVTERLLPEALES